MRAFKIVLKVLGILVLIVLIAAGGLAAYLRFALPKVSPVDANLKIELTPERVQRGDYLVNNVMDCFGCHGVKTMDAYTFPVDTATRGAGGFRIPRDWKMFPGDVTAPNITPHALGSWSDGEILRAMVSGIGRDGRVLFPMMPYPALSKLDREDIYSIIAYLRTLPSKDAVHRATEVDFPLNLIIRTLPADPVYSQRPDGSDEIAAGAYLVKAADCLICHTVVDKQENPIGPHFAGGRVFDLPPIAGVIRTANITPDSATGIGTWTREAFIQVIRTRGARANAYARVGPDEPNTVMPYGIYAGMTDEDLGAIYAYLRTITPVNNTVVRWTPRSPKN
jgi:hypothetical protein